MPESSSGEGGGAAATTTRSASASARSAARRPIAPAPGRSDEMKALSDAVMREFSAVFSRIRRLKLTDRHAKL
jgi:hypothetical protein